MNTRRMTINAAVGTALAGLSLGAAAQTINLKLHHFLGPKSPAHARTSP